MSVSKKHKVLYFSMVPLTYPSGGGICCFNHVRKLTNHPDLELTVATMGSCKFETEERNRLSGLKLNHWYLTTEGSKEKSGIWPGLFQTAQEQYSLRSGNIDSQLKEFLSDTEFDTIVIDYLFSILFAPSLLSHPAQKIIITLNREAEFMNDEIERSTGIDYFVNRIKQWRIARFERKVFNSVDKAVFLSDRDIPEYDIKANAYVVTPELEDKLVSWNFCESQNILFVGSIEHPPNQKAVDWICDRLAPELQKLNQGAKITIVSRVKDDSRKNLPSTVEWLSDVDQSQLENLMTTCDLFISPIENDFGVKFKLLECLSHKTPFIATEGCLCGLPYLSGLKPIELDNPKGVAEMIFEYLNNRELLEGLSMEQHKKERFFRLSNKNIWYDVIADGTNNNEKLDSDIRQENRVRV